MTAFLSPEAQALMLKVADYIDEHHDEYNQGEWCGTTRCVAGTAAFLIHGNPIFEEPREWWPNGKKTIEYIIDGEKLAVWDVAQTELGLTTDLADVLFDEKWRPSDPSQALRDLTRAHSSREMYSMIKADFDECYDHAYADDDWDDGSD